MIIDSAKLAFHNAAFEYTDLLSIFYPASGESGFCERNLTYRFCKKFEGVWNQQHQGSCFLWMEFPLPRYRKKHAKRDSVPHIDSVIFVFSKGQTSAMFIEGKRIKEGKYNEDYKSIVTDISRMKNKANRKYILGHIPKKFHLNGIDEYVFFLADVWIGNTKRSQGVPSWWANQLPGLTGSNSSQQTFFHQIKKYKSSTYNILGLIEKL